MTRTPRTPRTLSAPRLHPDGCGLAPSGSPYGGESPEVRRPIRTLRAGATFSAYLLWAPLTRYPRTPLVTCVECHRSELNEWNRLHRGGWQQSGTWRLAFRCGDCARSNQ